MKLGTWKLMATGITLLVLGTFTSHAAPPARVDDPLEGERLARELRTGTPPGNVEISGVLRITAPGRPVREVPVKSTVTVRDGAWTSIYEAKTADAPAEKLIIHHTIGKPTQYEWHRGDSVRRLTGAEATNAFAGSDFALMDLGLEFYHWPTQTLAFREMRKGRGADVLESRAARPTLYSRVLSWIDQDTRGKVQAGLLMAEGYDASGNLLKEFEIRKITREGELREIEIRDRQRKSTTRLRFESSEE